MTQPLNFVDEKFIKELGIASLPKEKLAKLAADIDSQIEERVNDALMDALTDEQFEELDGLEEKTTAQLLEYLNRVAPEFATSPEYVEAKRSKPEVIDDVIRATATLVWLIDTVPDYEGLVNRAVAEAKADLLNHLKQFRK